MITVEVTGPTAASPPSKGMDGNTRTTQTLEPTLPATLGSAAALTRRQVSDHAEWSSATSRRI